MIRKITIEAVLNGFKVRVGCQEVVFGSIESLLADLGAYLRNPDEVEKIFLTSALNAGKLIADQAIAEPPVYAEAERASNAGQVEPPSNIEALVERLAPIIEREINRSAGGPVSGNFTTQI